MFLSVHTGASDCGFFHPRSELCGVKGNPRSLSCPQTAGSCLCLSEPSYVSYLTSKREEQGKVHPVHSRRRACFQNRLFLLTHFLGPPPPCSTSLLLSPAHSLKLQTQHFFFPPALYWLSPESFPPVHGAATYRFQACLSRCGTHSHLRASM